MMGKKPMHASKSPLWSGMMQDWKARQGCGTGHPQCVLSKVMYTSHLVHNHNHGTQHNTQQCSNKQRAVMACQSPHYRNLPGDLCLNCGVILLESLHTAAPIPFKPHKDETSSFCLSHLLSLPPSLSLYPLSFEPAWWTSVRHSSIVKHTKMLLTLKNKMTKSTPQLSHTPSSLSTHLWFPLPLPLCHHLALSLFRCVLSGPILPIKCCFPSKAVMDTEDERKWVVTESFFVG